MECNDGEMILVGEFLLIVEKFGFCCFIDYCIFELVIDFFKEDEVFYFVLNVFSLMINDLNWLIVM